MEEFARACAEDRPSLHVGAAMVSNDLAGAPECWSCTGAICFGGKAGVCDLKGLTPLQLSTGLLCTVKALQTVAHYRAEAPNKAAI